MNEKITGKVDAQTQAGMWKIFLLCLPMIIITLMILSQGKLPTEPGRLFAFVFTLS
jgi:hypothetical protein